MIWDEINKKIKNINVSQEYNVLILGQANSGKTTILRKILKKG
jgi:GTPase SAR1 family protein